MEGDKETYHLQPSHPFPIPSYFIHVLSTLHTCVQVLNFVLFMQNFHSAHLCAGVKLRVIHAKFPFCTLRVIHAFSIPHTCVQVLNFVLFMQNSHSAHLCAGVKLRVIHAFSISHPCVQVLNFMLFTHNFHSAHLCAGAELRACSGAGAQGEPPVH